MSRAEFHCYRLTTVQDIQDYASHFWHTQCMCNTPPLFHGNISVADCMSHSVLKTIKVDVSVECTWCMTKQRSIIGDDRLFCQGLLI